MTSLGGAQLAALRVARGLLDRGYKTKVLFLYERESLSSPDHPYEVLQRAARPSALGYSRLWLDLARKLREEAPDAVLTFLPLASLLGALVAARQGVHKRIISHRIPVSRIGPVLRMLDTLWAWCGIYTDIVAVSEAVRQSCTHYPAWLRERTVVVHNAAPSWAASALTREEARDQFGISEDMFLLVAVGRLAAQKNYPFMLRVVQRVKGATLLIAGHGPLRVQLEGLIRSLGIERRVRLLGPIPRVQVSHLLTGADVFLQTSTYEGQSNSLLEALGTGIPILASDIPENRETIADPNGSVAGALLPLGNVEAWTTAIKRFREDTTLAQAAREVALLRSQQFGYEAMITGFDRVIKNS